MVKHLEFVLSFVHCQSGLLELDLVKETDDWRLIIQIIDLLDIVFVERSWDITDLRVWALVSDDANLLLSCGNEDVHFSSGITLSNLHFDILNTILSTRFVIGIEIFTSGWW
jgi:hypothetical protein